MRRGDVARGRIDHGDVGVFGRAKRNIPNAPLATIEAIRMNAAAKLPLRSVSRPTITGINRPDAEKNVIMIPVAAPVRSR